MTTDEESDVTGFIAGIVISSVIWIAVIAFPVRYVWQDVCVNHRAAHYHTTTARFVWNDEAKDGNGPRAVQSPCQAESEGVPGK